jgi:hypothetical protein
MIGLLRRNHTRNVLVQSGGSKLIQEACEGAHISKEITISDHPIVMLELVNILYFPRLSEAVVVTIKLDLG